MVDLIQSMRGVACDTTDEDAACLLREAADALEAALEDARILQHWQDAVFSGNEVIAALGQETRRRTSPENVCDVLDAVASVARTAIDAAREARNG